MLTDLFTFLVSLRLTVANRSDLLLEIAALPARRGRSPPRAKVIPIQSEHALCGLSAPFGVLPQTVCHPKGVLSPSKMMRSRALMGPILAPTARPVSALVAQ